MSPTLCFVKIVLTVCGLCAKLEEDASSLHSVDI